MKRILSMLALALALAALSQSTIYPVRAGSFSDVAAITNPILFVTQVPVPADYTTVGSVIGNQRADLESAPRGGDLWIRYPDGTLKNLTQAAGYGTPSAGGCGGAQNCQGANAIAVRDPAVYWDGTKAIFSMVVGAPTKQFDYKTYYWQLYEITGLGKNQTPVITKVANQPANYNNISPTYGTDDRIIFASDRPRNGASWLYPQLDEYESAATVTGLWSLNPQSGDLFLMNHAVSGAFTPFVDSYGRVIFTRWDHLQRDQQADTDYEQNAPTNPPGSCSAYCTFNYADETQNAQRLQTRAEIFPEPRSSRTDLLQGTDLVGHSFNDFAPWQIHEDGTGEETLNHVGRHELLGYIEMSLNDDPDLQEFYGQYARTNQNPIENFLEIEQDPNQPTRYFGIDAPEFETHASGQVISMNGDPTLNADQMSVTYWTDRSTASFTNNPTPANTGHYRDVLPLMGGVLIAAHTAYTDEDTNTGNTAHPGSHYDFRLKTLKQLPNSSMWGPDQLLTSGINKTLSYWNPDTLVTYSGALWEWEPVEVRARTRPQKVVETLPTVEQSVFTQAGVSLAAFQQYLKTNNLALMVSRDVTQRDDADLQQPFDLKVANGGVQTLSKNYQSGNKIYTVKFLQLFQGDQVRGEGGTVNPYAGRRVLAQYMHDAAAVSNNPTLANAPQSSVAIAADGSVAAFVPARRAMAWQMTDAGGTPVVRERVWITFQPGEVRVCTSCHGVNDKDQAGNAAATNAPQALLQVLQAWKAQNGGGPPPTSTPTPTATQSPTPVGTVTATRTPQPTGTPASGCDSKPVAPVLLAPTNGSAISKQRVMLDWGDMNCATRYKVQLRVGSASSAVIDSKKTTASSYRTQTLTTGKAYYWRVKACDAFGCSAWAAASFTIQ